MPLLVALAIAPCPTPVEAQLDGLYRWQVARQKLRGPIGITSQQGRFTDIVYPNPAGFRLSSYLDELLAAKR